MTRTIHTFPCPHPNGLAALVVVHDPESGSVKPFEVRSLLASGRIGRRVSFKTEAAAMKHAETAAENIAIRFP